MNARDWSLLLLLSVLWGGSFFFARIAVGEIPPLTVMATRVGIAAAALLALAAALGRAIPLAPGIWAQFAVMGLINNVVPFSLLFWGQVALTAGHAAILNATTPLFTVIVAHALTQDERITAGKLAGVLAGFLGVVAMIGPAALATIDRAVLAQIACLGGALSYAFAGVYGRRFRRMGLDPLVTAFGQVAAATVLALPLAALADRPWTLPWPSAGTLAALAGLGVVSTAFGYILYFRILASAGATNLLLVTFLIPASAILLGATFLGEGITPAQLAGMTMIGGGLALIDGRVLRRVGQ